MSDRESLDDQPQKYGNTGGMDTGSADFDSGQQGQQGEQELATKMLQIQSKRFYLDVKQNKRGRFIKVAEIAADGRRSQIFMALSIASEFRNHLSTFSDFYASLGPPNPDNVPDDGKLKSEMMMKDNRRYYLDLKENARGRFLRVSQTITRGGSRTQIAIPAQGMIEFRDALTDLLEEFGTDDGGFKGDLPEARYVRVDSKNFYFDVGQNNRGIYMRISEVKTNFRTAITVPEKSWSRFRDIFATYCNQMNEGGGAISGSSVGGSNSSGGGGLAEADKGSTVTQVQKFKGSRGKEKLLDQQKKPEKSRRRKSLQQRNAMSKSPAQNHPAPSTLSLPAGNPNTSTPSDMTVTSGCVMQEIQSTPQLKMVQILHHP